MPPSPTAAHDRALRVSEARYRRLFETAQDGILLLNAHTGQIEGAPQAHTRRRFGTN